MVDVCCLGLLVIGVVALLVLGAQHLPEGARTARMSTGKIKRTVSGMQREINAQLEADELRQKLNEQQKKLDESLNKVKRDVERYDEPDTSADTTGNSENNTDTTANSTRPVEGTPTQKSETALGGDEPLADSAASSNKDSSNR